MLLAFITFGMWNDFFLIKFADRFAKSVMFGSKQLAGQHRGKWANGR
jgi:hypothetical protein